MDKQNWRLNNNNCHTYKDSLSYNLITMEQELPELKLSNKNSFLDDDRPSSLNSLERISSNDYRLRNSLAYVMSIESDKNSQLYQRMINIEERMSGNIINRNSDLNTENKGNQNLQFLRGSSNKNNKRESEPPRNPFHICACDLTCEKSLCPCFSKQQQFCIKGICCEQCVILKNQTISKQIKSGCLCKNVKCLKMYCKCFQKKVPCGKQCKCEGCQNTPQFYGLINYNQVQNQTLKGKNRQQTLQLSKQTNLLNNTHRCSCNKSNCLKKYCSCFNNGFKCGVYCLCVNCQNMDEQRKQRSQYFNQDQKEQFRRQIQRYAIHNQQLNDNQPESMSMKQEIDIEQYLQDQNAHKQIPKRIDFQPIDIEGLIKKSN